MATPASVPHWAATAKRLEKTQEDLPRTETNDTEEDDEDKEILAEVRENEDTRKPSRIVVESFDSVFARAEVVLNLHWLLAFSAMTLVTALIALIVAPTAGLAPAVQTNPPYSFTWTMLIPSAVVPWVGLPTASLRNADLVFATFILQLLLTGTNVGLMILQFIGIFAAPVNFFTREGWFGGVIMTVVTVFSAVAFFAVLGIYLSLTSRARYRPRCCAGKQARREGTKQRA